MIQILPADNPYASLGSALGTGLGEGLNRLASYKLQEIEQTRKTKQRSNLLKTFYPDLDNEQLSALANTPDEIFKLIFERGITGPNQQQPQQPQQQYQQDQMQQQFPELEQIGSNPQAQQVSALDALNAVYGGQIPSQFRNQQQQPNQQIQPEQVQQNPVQAQQIIKPKSNGLQLGKSKEEKALEEKRLSRLNKEKLENYKLTADYRDNLSDKAQDAKNSLFRIKQAEDLQKTGKLDTQAQLAFLNAAGLKDVQGLLSGETQAYEKILADFQKDAKTHYGTRITNFDLEQFLKTIPNLYQSPEGRKRIFSLMKYWNRGMIEEDRIANQIIEENGGTPPLDLKVKTRKRLDKSLDKIADKFNHELKEALTYAEESQGSSKTKVALAHAGGKLLSKTPEVLAGGLAGGAAGSFLPGIGTALGAAGGGLSALGLSGLRDLFKG